MFCGLMFFGFRCSPVMMHQFGPIRRVKVTQWMLETQADTTNTRGDQRPQIATNMKPRTMPPARIPLWCHQDCSLYRGEALLVWSTWMDRVNLLTKFVKRLAITISHNWLIFGWLMVNRVTKCYKPLLAKRYSQTKNSQQKFGELSEEENGSFTKTPDNEQGPQGPQR